MKLAHALIAKSIADTILVGSLAVGFFFYTFPPSFKGWDEVQPHSISGWAVNQFAPFERVNVQLFIDGEFVATAKADLSRPDVMAAGWTNDEWHGYAFAVSGFSAGVHTARVYALHSSGGGVRASLQMLGDPASFLVAPDGSLRPALHK